VHTTTTLAHRHAGAAGSGLALLASMLFTAPLVSQEHTHSADDSHGTHFTRPLFAESVSPDTKLRLDYGFRDLEEGGESELELSSSSGSSWPGSPAPPHGCRRGRARLPVGQGTGP
jgi:hypothetical protein